MSEAVNTATEVETSPWLKAVPSPKAQEFVSVAFFRGLIAQAGLSTMVPEWDDGTDIVFGSSKELDGDIPANSWISAQVKSTSQWAEDENAISYFLRRKAWDKLKQRNSMPALLVLYLMPEMRRSWITSVHRLGVFRHCALYLWARELPVTCNSTGVTIRIARTNVVTAESLISLYKSVYPVAESSGGAA